MNDEIYFNEANMRMYQRELEKYLYMNRGLSDVEYDMFMESLGLFTAKAKKYVNVSLDKAQRAQVKDELNSAKNMEEYVDVIRRTFALKKFDIQISPSTFGFKYFDDMQSKGFAFYGELTGNITPMKGRKSYVRFEEFDDGRELFGFTITSTMNNSDRDFCYKIRVNVDNFKNLKNEFDMKQTQEYVQTEYDNTINGILSQSKILVDNSVYEDEELKEIKVVTEKLEIALRELRRIQSSRTTYVINESKKNMNITIPVVPHSFIDSTSKENLLRYLATADNIEYDTENFIDLKDNIKVLYEKNPEYFV